jgi:leucyl/phenylalanyl-tRNA--protein transferase
VTRISWLEPGSDAEHFPPPEGALHEPNGLLAAGGDLAPERLLAAYRRGIFPWYERGQPILWWSPDPRAVLLPPDLHVSRSLRRRVARGTYHITVDVAFERVIEACAGPRRYGDATWITTEMAAAYVALHRRGWAHSFEAWSGRDLVGGLYGVAIGRVFFGESMFAKATDASKVAFVHAVGYLQRRGFELIDCQVASPHLRSLGASDMSRAAFIARLAELCADAGISSGKWTAEDVAHAS